MGMKILAACVLIAGCAKSAKTAPATPPEVLTYDAVADRALTYKDADGAVTSPGKPDHGAGDRVIFTGLEAYGLDCTRGEGPAGFLHSIAANPRGNIDLDAILGLYRGIAKRMDICGDSWGADLGLLHTYLAANPSVLPPSFDFVEAAVEYKAGIGIQPTADAQALLEAVVTGWVVADQAARMSCYRINLALISLQTIEAVGFPMSATARDAFCVAALPSKIATVEQFCGKPGLADYLSTFQYNLWQYKHQRCAVPDGWETPDGIDEAGVDYLVAYRDLHGQ